MQSVDIVVPSARLDVGPLTAILDMVVPQGVRARWFIVADSPGATVPAEVLARVDGLVVTLIRNATNLGSAGSRNAGLDASDAEWILFLDDDVTPTPELLVRYADAVAAQPAALGFFGPTRFQAAQSQYQRGVEVSDILTFFRVAEYMRALPWAPTSNVLVRGAAARNERFRTVFPKGGGGEDIDYLLRVARRAAGEFSAVPSAFVDHPWWFNGARDYSRFMRWSFGDSLLHDLHPEHCYRSAPNAVEVLALGVPVAALAAAATASLAPVAALVIGVPLGEVVAEFARLAALKGWPECLYCGETVLIRSSNDVGRLAMQLRLGRWRGVCERWDHFCNGEHIAYHKRWAALKLATHLVAAGIVAWLAW